MIETILGIIIGILVACLGFFIYTYKGSFKQKDFEKFQAEQAQILAGLTEKKNAALKEIKDEEDAYRDQLAEERAAAIQGLDEELSRAKDQYRMQEDILAANYKDKSEAYTRNAALLEEQYKELQTHYKDKELSDAAERQSRLEEKIKAEEQFLHSNLSALQADYKDKAQELETSFFQYSEQINGKREALQKEIEEYEAHQKQIIARFKEDEEKRQQADFYRVKINAAEKADIVKLKELALTFSKPEALYKLIYEVYYKTRLEELFKRILGDNKDKGGIYKITNINSQKVYIGKTTGFLNRWRTHAKRGCGIERISGKLYDEMMDAGLENFTWEVIEVCSKEQQNEREKYWIKFYNSDSYGYNSTKGG